MPILDDNLEEHKIPNSNFGFSATPTDELGATEYTLASVVVDISASTTPFRKEMEEALKETVKTLRLSPRADNLMLRVVLFGSRVEELHGFKLLEHINEDDYNNTVSDTHLGGSTALYDATLNSVGAITKYAGDLRDGDFDANAIFIVITDGEENASSTTINKVKQEMQRAITGEALESVVSILVGINVNDPYVSKALNKFNTDAGFSQYVEAKDADKKTLAKLANFVSRSISSQSNSLGTGTASKSLVF